MYSFFIFTVDFKQCFGFFFLHEHIVYSVDCIILPLRHFPQGKKKSIDFRFILKVWPTEGGVAEKSNRTLEVLFWFLCGRREEHGGQFRRCDCIV